MKRSAMTLALATFLVTACGADSKDLSTSRNTRPPTTTQTETKIQTKAKPDSRDHASLAYETIDTIETMNRAGSSIAFQDGLLLEVTNRLGTHEPRLSVEVCSRSLENSQTRKPGEKQSRLCFVSESMVEYGETQNFYLPAKDVQRLLSIGGTNSIQIRFNDDYSQSLIHWHCWEHPSTEIADAKGLTRFKVEATQINLASYSCRIK